MQIIEKILSNARAEADLVLREAENVSHETIVSCETLCAEKIESAKKAVAFRWRIGEKQKSEQFLREQSLAKSAEQVRILRRCFDIAMQEFVSDTERYTAYIKRIMDDNIENGESVIVCGRDRDLAIFKDVAVQEVSGNFLGGIKIVGINADKDFTVERIFGELFESLSQEISEVLFGE